MPKKSRKGRRKYKAQQRPKLSAVKEARQVQPAPVLPRQALVAKPQTTVAQQADRHGQTIAELKRISLIAVILLVLLIILCLLVR
jgi:hypothetical protein